MKTELTPLDGKGAPVVPTDAYEVAKAKRLERERNEDIYLVERGLKHLTTQRIDAIYPSLAEYNEYDQLCRKIRGGNFLTSGTQATGQDHVTKTRVYEGRRRWASVIEVTTEVFEQGRFNVQLHNKKNMDADDLQTRIRAKEVVGDQLVDTRYAILDLARKAGELA